MEGQLVKPIPPLENGAISDLEEAKSNVESLSPKRKRRTKAEIYNWEHLIKVVKEVLTPEPVKRDPESWKKIGEEYHDELDYQPGRVQVARTVIEKYVPIKVTSQGAPIQAKAPESKIPGAMITPAMAAQLIIDKHCDHLPHDRQSKRFWRESGIDLSRQTINQWVHLTAKHLTPINKAILVELRNSPVLQIDETPIKYLESGIKHCRQGYLWVMRDPQKLTAYYHWDQGRSLEALKSALGYDESTQTIKFSGTIQCDGYRVYPALASAFEGIKLAGCLAHIRRKFIEHESLQAHGWVKEVIHLIQQLYQIESQLKSSKAPPDKRLKIRQAKAKPIVERLYKLLTCQQREYTRPKSLERVAINYALGQWSSFELYLEDGRLEIDNNGAENAVRPTKLNLKNCLFFGNAQAGHKNAVLYTLIENCKAVDLNARVYLEYVLNKYTNYPASELTPIKVKARLAQSQRCAA